MHMTCAVCHLTAHANMEFPIHHCFSKTSQPCYVSEVSAASRMSINSRSSSIAVISSSSSSASLQIYRGGRPLAASSAHDIIEEVRESFEDEENNNFLSSEDLSSLYSGPPPSVGMPRRTCFELLLCIWSCPKSFVNGYKFRKLPFRSGVLLIYAMMFFLGIGESCSFLLFFLSLNSFRGLDSGQSMAIYLIARCGIFTMYPVMGFLADTYFGRYKVLVASLTISWIGSAILTIFFSISDPFFTPEAHWNPDYNWPSSVLAMLAVCYAIVGIGFTGITVNLIPFGVDQLPDASAGELSSYFHCYFWFYNAGTVVGRLTLPTILASYALSYSLLVINGATCFIIVILVLSRSKLIILPKLGNPLRLVFDVLRYAYKAKPNPFYRSAFQVGQPYPKGLDLAMTTHGGVFSVEQVEDVKTFFRILFLLLSFFGYFVISSQLETTYLLQGMRMTSLFSHGGCSERLERTLGQVIRNRTVNCHLFHTPPYIGMNVASTVLLLIIIPFFDRLIYPCVGGKLTILKRIGIGNLFILASICVALGMEVYRVDGLLQSLQNATEGVTVNVFPFHTTSSLVFYISSPVSALKLAPQYALFKFASLFGTISAIEFIYAQSPAHMQGILFGLLFGTEGLASGVLALFIFLQNQAPEFSLLAYFANTNDYYKYATSANCTNHSTNSTTSELLLHGCVDSPLFTLVFFATAAFISGTVFLIFALRYKLRRRAPDPYLPIWLIPGTVNDQTLCEKICCCYNN